MEYTSIREIKLQADLTLRHLQAAPGADREAVARAFEPLIAAIATAQKETRRYETKEMRP